MSRTRPKTPERPASGYGAQATLGDPRPEGVEANDQVGTVAHAMPLAAPILAIVASLLWIPTAGLLALAIDRIAAGEGASAILSLAIGILALGIARTAAEAVSARVAFRSARWKLSISKRRALANVARTSPLDKSRLPSGAVASLLAEQSEAIVPYLSRYGIARCRSVAVPIAILACVFALSWAAAFVLLIAAPLIPIFMALIGWRAKRASEEQLVEMGNLNAFLLDRLRGMATIRSLGAVDLTATRVRQEAEALRSWNIAVLRIAFLSSAVLEFFAALGVTMTAVFVGFHLLGEIRFGTWSDKLTLGEGLFILLLAPAYFEPLRELASIWHDRAAGTAAIDALTRISNDRAQIMGRGISSRSEAGVPAGPPALSIEKLSFRHRGTDIPTLTAFDMRILPGERVAIVAPSGAGKSTLLALIAGLAAPDRGTITIGGERLSPDNADRLRSGMCWVGQRPHVFAGTLVSNVRLGADLSKREALNALEVARLGQLASERGAALIGEGGTGISGGEIIRLALARIAASPHATLILADEPTAHLDTKTAHEVSEALIRLSRGRTMIVATHDAELASRMDRVVHLRPSYLEVAA